MGSAIVEAAFGGAFSAEGGRECVALVHPAGCNFSPGQADLRLFGNRMAPIGILSLASWLDKHGHKTMLLDCFGPNPPQPPARRAPRTGSEATRSRR